MFLSWWRKLAHKRMTKAARKGKANLTFEKLEDRVTPSFTPTRPLLLVPGVVGSMAADDPNVIDEWFVKRGIEPEKLQVDPVAGTYDDLIKTLDDVGYTPGEDFFVATYDWRLPVGPTDGLINANIDRTATQL